MCARKLARCKVASNSFDPITLTDTKHVVVVQVPSIVGYLDPVRGMRDRMEIGCVKGHDACPYRL